MKRLIDRVQSLNDARLQCLPELLAAELQLLELVQGRDGGLAINLGDLLGAAVERVIGRVQGFTACIEPDHHRLTALQHSLSKSTAIIRAALFVYLADVQAAPAMRTQYAVPP